MVNIDVYPKGHDAFFTAAAMAGASGSSKVLRIVTSIRVSRSSLASLLSLLLCGIPQGGILGPLLFLWYINDKDNNLIHSKVHLYAQDTVIYATHEDMKTSSYSQNSSTVIPIIKDCSYV